MWKPSGAVQGPNRSPLPPSSTCRPVFITRIRPISVHSSLKTNSSGSRIVSESSSLVTAVVSIRYVPFLSTKKTPSWRTCTSDISPSASLEHFPASRISPATNSSKLSSLITMGDPRMIHSQNSSYSMRPFPFVSMLRISLLRSVSAKSGSNAFMTRRSSLASMWPLPFASQAWKASNILSPCARRWGMKNLPKRWSHVVHSNFPASFTTSSFPVTCWQEQQRRQLSWYTSVSPHDASRTRFPHARHGGACSSSSHKGQVGFFILLCIDFLEFGLALGTAWY
mmetsp:Transcript_1952/g.5681  ORF Transcript_1952/g.5681 Transcript_1952/m.5681 type:complete len:282 (-) Transcript_1952:121-966(-)